MKQFLRRLRGIIGSGLTWAVGWVALGMGYSLFHGASILSAIPGNASVGFIFGSVFAVILSVAERHRRLEDLSIPRMGLWGALTALLIVGALQLGFQGTLHWDLLSAALFTGTFSAGHVALAKRADTKLFEGDDEPLPALEGE